VESDVLIDAAGQSHPGLYRHGRDSASQVSPDRSTAQSVCRAPPVARSTLGVVRASALASLLERSQGSRLTGGAFRRPGLNSPNRNGPPADYLLTCAEFNQQLGTAVCSPVFCRPGEPHGVKRFLKLRIVTVDRTIQLNKRENTRETESRNLGSRLTKSSYRFCLLILADRFWDGKLRMDNNVQRYMRRVEFPVQQVLFRVTIVQFAVTAHM